jgi:hypothetical protein
MIRRFAASLAVAAAALLLAGPAPAEETKKPDATLKLSEGSVAAGVGRSWGRGTLTYQGKTHHFKVDGLSVGEVGFTKAEARGEVYNLKKLEDFSGLYQAGSAGITVGKGAGVTALQNEKNGMVLLKSATKGASPKVAGEGLKIRLEK